MWQNLKELLLADLVTVGIDIDNLTFDLRPYHSRFLGQYDFPKKKAVVYVYINKEKTQMRSYASLLDTALHEGAHHTMNFETTVMRGNEHPQRFYDLYNRYIKIARRKKLFNKVVNYETKKKKTPSYIQKAH